MLFSALFPLAGRGKASSGAIETAEVAPSEDSLRVTASALRAWATKDDTEVRVRGFGASER